jgi:hypothetical protein
MAKEKIISLKNAKKIFPNEIMRLRAHDLIGYSVDKRKLLLKKEIKALQETANEIREGIFGGNMDVLAIRKGKKIKIIPFK